MSFIYNYFFPKPVEVVQVTPTVIPTKPIDGKIRAANWLSTLESTDSQIKLAGREIEEIKNDSNKVRNAVLLSVGTIAGLLVGIALYHKSEVKSLMGKGMSEEEAINYIYEQSQINEAHCMGY